MLGFAPVGKRLTRRFAAKLAGILALASCSCGGNEPAPTSGFVGEGGTGDAGPGDSAQGDSAANEAAAANDASANDAGANDTGANDTGANDASNASFDAAGDVLGSRDAAAADTSASACPAPGRNGAACNGLIPQGQRIVSACSLAPVATPQGGSIQDGVYLLDGITYYERRVRLHRTLSESPG